MATAISFSKAFRYGGRARSSSGDTGNAQAAVVNEMLYQMSSTRAAVNRLGERAR